MTSEAPTAIPTIVTKYESELLSDWVKLQLADVTLRRDLLRDDELREQVFGWVTHSAHVIETLETARERVPA